MLISLFNIFAIAVCAWIVYKRLKPALSGSVYMLAFLFKLTAGILLGVMYFDYYELGDTIVYHNKASELVDLVFSDTSVFLDRYFLRPLPEFSNSPRALLMVQITTVFHFFTNNNYWISSLWFSFFSFTGFYFLCSTIVKVWPKQATPATIAFLFFPSAVFWSSGIIKESLALGALAFMFGFYILYAFEEKRRRYLILCLLFLLLIWLLKYYIAAVWIVVFISGLLLLNRPRYKLSWIIFAIIIFVIAGVTFTHPNFYPNRIVEVIYSNYEVYLDLSRPHEAMPYPYSQADIFFIILNAPVALFTALFMPILYFTFEPPFVFAVTENILIGILFIGWAFSRGKFNSESFNKKMKYMICAYVVILGIFLALSVPNFGTLSRFRVSFLPYFIWLLLADNYLLSKFKFNILQERLWIKNR